MINVQIAKSEEVSEDAARVIAHNFAEWLDSNGFSIEPKQESGAGPARALRDLDYEQLARAFVEEWG